MGLTFPVEVTKGKEKAKVFHPVDLQGWLDAGWKVAEKKRRKES